MDRKPLTGYSDQDKIKWFDEFYREAENYANETHEFNKKVYERMFINAAQDIVCADKPFRIYEFLGQVIINDYTTTYIDLGEGEG